MSENQDLTSARQAAGNATSEAGSGPVLRPDADIFEDADGISVTLDLPGVPRELLTIQVDKQSLTIAGEARIDTPAGLEPIHGEIRTTHYRRSFTLSNELEGERIEASLRDGVLQVRIPKRAEVKPRRIEVRTH